MQGADAPDDEVRSRLELLVSDALIEIRKCLGDKAINLTLPAALMSLATLIDKIQIDVDTIESDGSFEFSEESNHVTFSTSVVLKIVTEVVGMAEEVGVDEHHLVKISINMFIIHELLHIRQNFPHFGTVGIIKKGLGDIGLPLLDVAADTIAAHLCALIESKRAGDLTEPARMRWYVSCLIISYVIGNFVFTSEGPSKISKKQRAVGLLISAMLVQAKVDGQLDETKISSGWGMDTPLFALNGEKCGTFDAIVIDKLPTLLIDAGVEVPPEEVKAIWRAIGKRPISDILYRIGSILQRFRVIMPLSQSATASPPNNAP